MTGRFADIQKCVKDYYETCLQSGMSIVSVLATFREDPLPHDLVECGFTSNEIRRHGQLMGTRYLMDDRKYNELPEYDIIRG